WLLEAYNSLNNNVIQREDYQQAGIELNRALMDYIRLNDTIFNRVESNQIRELGGKYESTLKEEIIDNQEVEKESVEAKRNTYLASGILATLLSLTLFSLQGQKAKRNRFLLE